MTWSARLSLQHFERDTERHGTCLQQRSPSLRWRRLMENEM